MTPLPPLVCKECGHVNEGERVYCHGCGVKLDRDVLAAQQQQQQAPTPQQVRREVQKIMTHGNGFWRRTWRMLWKTVALAAIAAIVISAALPPEWASTGTEKENTPTPQLDIYLEKLLASPAGQRISITEAQLNAYLKRERFKKVPEWLTDWLPLKRIFVNFSTEQARITVQAFVAGYPLYAGLSGRLDAGPKTGLTAVCTGGFIGRLPIPPQIAEQAVNVLPILLGSFQHERRLLSEIASVEIVEVKRDTVSSDWQILLGSRGPASAPAAAPAPAAPLPAKAPALMKSGSTWRSL